MKAIVLAALLAASGSAHAVTVGCPPLSGGRPLARTDGAALYLGDPAANVELIPSNPGGVNTWILPKRGAVTIVCAYEGGGSRIALQVPPGVQVCRQTLPTNAPPTLACN